MSMRFTPKHTLEEIRMEMRTAKDGRYRLRLEMIALLIERPNISQAELCERLSISVYSTQQWRKRYEIGGLEALKAILPNGGNHNTTKVKSEHLDALLAQIDKQEEYWSVPKMREWIIKHYNKAYGVETLRYQLKKRGYSYKSARPSPYKANRDAQGRFKKTV